MTVAGLLACIERPARKNEDWRAADELARRGEPALESLLDRLEAALADDHPWADDRPAGETRAQTRRLWSRHWRLGQRIGHLAWLIQHRGEAAGDRFLATVLARATPSTQLTVALLALGDRETAIETRVASPVLLRAFADWVDDPDPQRAVPGARALLRIEPGALFARTARRFDDRALAGEDGARLAADLFAAAWSSPALRDAWWPRLARLLGSPEATAVWHLARTLARLVAATHAARLASLLPGVGDGPFTEIITALQERGDRAAIDTLRGLELDGDRGERVAALISRLEGTHVDAAVEIRHGFTASASADGGPVMVMPAEVAPLWRSTDTDHYDQACGVFVVELLPLGELAVLVMPEMYCQWMPIDETTALVSLYGDVTETHRHLLGADDPWTRRVGELRLPSGAAVLGAALDHGDVDYNDRVALAPGTYEIHEARIFDERGEIWAVRLRRH